ncbi:hypothetical protein AOR01nite_09050 [Acetobacter orleanensis]|uniref:Uncharacterized protein n=1 Tax=Acetobacter orleanensis TaxID=104099 RepID=A0A4Y3TKY0_9PROT|nr:hypothetical protein Abol_071_028 [Acetobacter orleanensis JCM 7639]GEB82428.1 hypothetical protein AOR01nite_09050 [Acetobacter orleanensis]
MNMRARCLPRDKEPRAWGEPYNGPWPQREFMCAGCAAAQLFQKTAKNFVLLF